jgi:ketosteroid isomerase-like protein
MSQENVAREQGIAFVCAYRRAWESWDFAGFVDLFTDDVVYVAHATQEILVGRAALADYIRKEALDQGQASVRMGSPLIDADHVAAEFWVTRTNEGQNWTTAGCFIARLRPDGRCALFREYWFDVEGHMGAYDGWGE